MSSPNNRDPVSSKPIPLVTAEAAPARSKATTDGEGTAPPANASPTASPAPAAPIKRSPVTRGWRKPLVGVAVAAGLAVGGYLVAPTIVLMLNTVSTDDAYVNGHVTFVAPRVAGQVVRVLVDDNYRVRKGDLLVQLDKEPFQIQVQLKQAAVALAQADLVAAKDDARGMVAQARGNRFKLENAIEQVNNEIALLRANAAALETSRARLSRAKADFERAKELQKTPGAISQQDVDLRQEAFRVADAQVTQSLEQVYQVRVSLGLPAKPPEGHPLTEVPADLDQNFSAVRAALSDLLRSAAPLGIFPTSYNATPKEVIANFYKRDPQGDLDKIFAKVLTEVPEIGQAEAKLEQAKSDLDQAELNLRWCDVVAEIDGVVTRRNVNPGNNLQAGQSLMAVRSLTEIWVDANFKETQLADLRIGQRVRCEIDMYGSRREYEGRITGFTMGTGQTLALLPPQNATGNFVKIVQRLPVRIEFTDYDPDKAPLFVGLSVEPYVYYKEPPTGPNAGNFLQPLYPLPQLPTAPKP